MTYKRGKKGIYWYRFMWQGELVRESTHQTNDKVARQMEAAHRTSLAKGEVGIRHKKPVPTLSDICCNRIEPWAKIRPSWLWYRSGIRPLLAYRTIASTKLDSITSEVIGLCGSSPVGWARTWDDQPGTPSPATMPTASC